MLIRKANIYDTTDIARLHAETWHSAYRRFFSDEYMDQQTLDKRKKYWMKFINDGRTVYVVEEKSGEIIGFIVPKLSKDEQRGYRGEVSALYVSDRFQRRGVGRLLMGTCARLLMNNEIRSMVIWSMKDLPASQFYKAMGGVEFDARLERVDNKDFLKLGYRWDDLSELVRLADIPIENLIASSADEDWKG